MEATEEQKSMLDRIVTNGMRVLSDPKTTPQVMGFLTAEGSAGERFSNALSFVLGKVVKSLLAKEVEVSPEVLMSENGGVSQLAQLVVMVMETMEMDITPNEIQKGIEVSLHNFSKSMSDGAKPQQPRQAPEQPQQQMPQQAPQQPPQGMLAGQQGVSQ
mgnify:CR=1 FL=1